CGEAFDGLRVSRADGFLASRRHNDDRTDRERIETRARSLLRRDDLDPGRNRRYRERKSRSAKQFAEEPAAHRATNRFQKMDSPLSARASGVPRALDPRTQILALSRADRQRLRRPEPVLFMPAGRRI